VPRRSRNDHHQIPAVHERVDDALKQRLRCHFAVE
jgi:hypothetical protein